MLLEGLHIPLTTPFHRDSRLNLHKLASNVVRYSLTPAAGLILLGPSGEPTLLSDDETRAALRAAAPAAAPEKILIAGIARDSVHSTLTLADFAASLDYDVVLIGPPSIAAEQRALVTWFQTIADRSPLPILLRNVPVNTAADLAAHPNILGLLTTESPGAVASLIAQTGAVPRTVAVTHVFSAVTTRMQKSTARSTLVSASSLAGPSLTAAPATIADPPPLRVRTRSKTVGFQILAGTGSANMHDRLLAGAVGVAPALAACAPQACYEVFAAWKDGDQPLAAEKQSPLSEIAAPLEALGPGGLKFACDLNGYFGGSPRLPHLSLTAEQRSHLEAALKVIRN